MNIKELFEAPVADIIIATSQPGISTPEDDLEGLFGADGNVL